MPLYTAALEGRAEGRRMMGFEFVTHVAVEDCRFSCATTRVQCAVCGVRCAVCVSRLFTAKSRDGVEMRKVPYESPCMTTLAR
jgi:hypothetical protein